MPFEFWPGYHSVLGNLGLSYFARQCNALMTIISINYFDDNYFDELFIDDQNETHVTAHCGLRGNLFALLDTLRSSNDKDTALYQALPRSAMPTCRPVLLPGGRLVNYSVHGCDTWLTAVRRHSPTNRRPSLDLWIVLHPR